jgi:hypothetical protein
MLANRGARDWTAEEVRGWFERVSGGRAGAHRSAVASRTDRAVFRFLLPRVLELLAAGRPAGGRHHIAVFAQFEPGRLAPGGTAPDDHAAFRVASAGPRAAGPGLAARPDLDLRLWPAAAGRCRVLCSRRRIDPDLPASLSRAWSRTHRDDSLFPGTWPPGAVSVLRATFVTPLMVERMMNYAMAEGTSHRETDDAMRAADLLLRNL